MMNIKGVKDSAVVLYGQFDALKDVCDGYHTIICHRHLLILCLCMLVSDSVDYRPHRRVYHIPLHPPAYFNIKTIRILPSIKKMIFAYR